MAPSDTYITKWEHTCCGSTNNKRLKSHYVTPFQKIHVYHLPLRRMRGINNNQSPPSDRALYLDGVLQSSLCSDIPYHKGLVHLGMLAHHDPRRVAIIGSREKATLQEVLKHTHDCQGGDHVGDQWGAVGGEERGVEGMEQLFQKVPCKKSRQCGAVGEQEGGLLRVMFWWQWSSNSFLWCISMVHLSFFFQKQQKKKAFHQRTITPLQTTELLVLIINK